jgi:hypothetical protein
MDNSVAAAIKQAIAEGAEKTVFETDAGGFGTSYNQGMTFETMFWQLLHRINAAACVEFIPGRDDKVLVCLPGGVTEFRNDHINDTRDIYCNTVRHVFDFITCKLEFWKPREGERDYRQMFVDIGSKMPKETEYANRDAYKNALIDYYRAVYRLIMEFADQNNYFAMVSSWQ